MTQRELDVINNLIEHGYFTAFRTGVFEDGNGKIHNVTGGDLETIIHNFEKAVKDGKEVPLSIEHNEGEESQQGIIENVIRYGDYLFAKAKNIKSEFLQKLKEGYYKFVSVALDDKYSLLHIGCTNRPAVEGLFPITKAFSKFSKEDSIVFRFEMKTPDKKKELTGLNNFNKCMQCLLGDDWANNQESKDNQFTQKINHSNKEEPMKDEPGAEVPETKQEDQKDQTAEFQKRITGAEQRAQQAEQKVKEAEEKLASIKEQKRKDAISTFTNKLLENKKLYPNEVEPMNEFLLQQNDRETYHFSKVSAPQTPLEFIQRFLENQPDRLPLDKIQGTKTAGQNNADNACFSRIKPENENLDLHYQAKALMDKEKISYETALSRLED